MQQTQPDSEENATSKPEPYNLDKRSAAKFLRVSIYTIDRYCIDRRIPHVKLNGRLVRFRVSDLVQFAERGRVA